MKEKHIPYFELVCAFEFEECPICFLIRDKVEKFYNDLLYENVNDIGFRQEFKENFGFCVYHSYKLASYNDSLAVALCYENLLNDVVKKLKNKEKRLFKEKRVCKVCELIKELEARYISLMFEYLNDSEFKEKFSKSKGLCVKNLQMFIEKNNEIPN